METQIEWIKSSPHERKKYRGMVVGWQNSILAINHLVSAFNEQYHKEDGEKPPHHGMKEIALKKLIASSIVELKCKVDEWVARLNKDGEDTTKVNVERKKYRDLLDRAEHLRGIRNISFHYGDVMLEADDLAQLYEDINKWDLQELNDILKAIYSVGNVAKEIALSKAG